MRKQIIVLSILAGSCLLCHGISSLVTVFFNVYGGLYLLAMALISLGLGITAFFIPKSKGIIFPLWIYSIAISVPSLIFFVEVCMAGIWAAPIFWVMAILWLVFSAASITLTTILFAKAKPFQKNKQVVAPEKSMRKGKPLVEPSATSDYSTSFEYIARAKELLDAGAITPEEFYELKRSVLH